MRQTVQGREIYFIEIFIVCGRSGGTVVEIADGDLIWTSLGGVGPGCGHCDDP